MNNNFSTVALLLRRAAIALLTCLSVLAGGCAVTQQTRQSLASYVQASDQIQLTANELLTDYSNRSKAQLDRKRLSAVPVQAAQEYPDKFYPQGDPKLVLTAEEKSVAQTRQALAVIREYNDMLVALAEGRSDREVREQTEAFGGALQSLVSIVGATIPGLAAFTQIGPTIIKLAQDAANREQLIQAVSQGRGPVDSILKHLELQTEPFYDLAVQGTQQAQIAAREAIQRAAAALAALSALHSPPLDPTIATKMAGLQAQVGDVARQSRTENAVKIPFPFVAGKPAADAEFYAQAEIIVQAMRTSAQKYAELVAAQNAYYDVMSKYVAALRQTRKGFDLLAASLTAPVDLRAEFNRLLKVAFELRDAVAVYRNPPVGLAP